MSLNQSSRFVTSSMRHVIPRAIFWGCVSAGLALLAGGGGASAQATFQTLHTFSDVQTDPEGSRPRTGLARAATADGTVYILGATMFGGPHGVGTIFRMKPDGSDFAVIHTLAFGAGGSNPWPGGLLAGPATPGQDQFLYGTTSGGGTFGRGTVFRVSASGSYAVLASFDPAVTGTDPSPLAFGPDGALYGWTHRGGSTGNGVVFRVTLDGTFTVLAALPAANGPTLNDGTGGPVAVDAQGNVYGMRSDLDGHCAGFGVENCSGVIYRVDPTGGLTVMHRFEDYPPGGQPIFASHGLVFGSDGAMYGSTMNGGPMNAGRIFRMTTAGSFTPVYEFGSGRDFAPHAPLIVGGDGMLYGINQAFRPDNSLSLLGVFRVNPSSGAYTQLAAPLPEEGINVFAWLTYGDNGYVYGIAGSNQPGVSGTAFRVSLPPPLADQNISFDSVGPVVYGAPHISLNATASSGLPVTFSVVSGPGAIAGDQLTVTGAGTVTVRASQAGNDSYAPAPPVEQVVQVMPAPLLVRPLNYTKPYGATLAVDAQFAGFVNGETPAALLIQPVCTSAASLQTASVGTYASSCFGATAANYAIAYLPGVVEVVRVPLVVSAHHRAKVYGQAVNFTGLEFTATGLVAGDVVSRVTLESTGASVAAPVSGSPYDIEPSAAVGTGLDNYDISYVSGLLSVSPRPLTIRAANGQKTYGQAYQFATPGFTVDPVAMTVSPGGAFWTGGVPGESAVADFNLDGRPDVASVQNHSVIVLHNATGFGGTFMAPLTYPVGGSPFGVRAGDFNGDGAPDLVSVNFSGNNVSVLLNQGNGTFSPAVHYATSPGIRPTAIVTGDLNGDGVLDLAVVNSIGSSITMRGLGDGTFTGAAATFTVGAGASSIAAADFNGDGRVDLAVGCFDETRVYLGQGTMAVGAPTSYPLVGAIRSLTSADLNGDGASDLAAVLSSGQAAVWMNNGGGGFAAAATHGLNVGTVGTQSLAVADIDGDGRLDLAGSSTSNGGGTDFVSVLLQTGTGFAAPQRFAPGHIVSAVATIDLNGDGLPDIVSTGNTGVRLFNNATVSSGLIPGDSVTSVELTSNGVPGQAPVAGSPYVITANHAMGVGLDNYTISYATGSLTIAKAPLTVTADNKSRRIGQPNPPLTATLSGFVNGEVLATSGVTGAPALSTTAVAASPVSPPTYPITATIGSLSAANYAFSTFVAGALTVLPPPPPPVTVAITAADKFYDGTTTAAITSCVASTPEVGCSASNSTFDTASAGEAKVVVATVHLTGANASDYMLASTTATTTASVRRRPLTITATNQAKRGGTATALQGTEFVTTGARATFALSWSLSTTRSHFDLEVDDLNNDGYLDIASAIPDRVLVYPATGFGTFALPVEYPTGGSKSNAQVELGDFDSDGNIDLAVSFDGSAISVRFGSGDGTFHSAVNIAGASSWKWLQAADVNHDGNLDIVAGSVSGGVTLLGNGDRTFSPAVPHPPTELGAGGAVADLNGDGLLDLVRSDWGAGCVQVRFGLADGEFEGDTCYETLTPVRVATGDLNGDGHADVVIGRFANGAAVFLNQGDGELLSVASIPVADALETVAIEDVSGDGLLDLIFAEREKASVHPGFGDGTFSTATDLPISGGFGSVAILDLNQDRRADLVGGCMWEGCLVTFINQGASGLIPGDLVTSVTLLSSGLAADAHPGPYLIQPSNAVGIGLSNYDITYVDGTLTVTPNPAPTATPQSVATPEDTAVSITLAGTDPDAGTVLTFAIATSPAHGTVTLVGNVATYVPALNYAGTDSLTFTVRDEVTTSAPAAVSIQVTPVNDRAVVTVSGNTQVVEGQTVQLVVTATDVDDAALVLSYTSFVTLTGATLVESVPGTFVFTWTPPFGQLGFIPIVFRATDPGGLTGSGSVVLRVSAAPPNTLVGMTTPVQASSTVTVQFGGVTVQGITRAVTMDPAAAGALPAAYLSALAAVDVTTTATVTGPIVSCFVVSGSVDEPTFTALRVLHGEGGALVDRTILSPASPVPDFATRTLCAQTESLSPFVIAIRDTTPPVVAVTEITVSSTVAAGTVVNYAPTATDNHGEVTVVCSPTSGSLFPIGRTEVSCTATDTADNSTTATFFVTVVDGVPPAVTVPADQVIEATSPQGAVATFEVTATDNQPGVTVSCAPASGATLPLGITTVQCTATDAAANTAAASLTVTVRDTTAPVLALVDATATAASGTSAAVTFSASATDIVDGPVTPACTIAGPGGPIPVASGHAFPIGATLVTCHASDTRGNSSTGTLTVTVNDGGAPVVTVPGDMTREATSPAGATATFSATAVDNLDTQVAATCAPASGTVFPIGATTVSCSATDHAGNTGTATFIVTVSDTTAPALTLPAPITVAATQPTGVAVTFVAAAVDVVDGATAVTCAPASGSVFAVGTTTVTCTTVDTRGNASAASFDVTVTLSAQPIGRFVVFSRDETSLRSNVKVVSGDIGANERRYHGHTPVPEDNGREDVTVRVGQNVKMLEPASRVVGSTVVMLNKASVQDVVTNLLFNTNGTVHGTITNPMDPIPYLALPVFPQVTPGTTAVEVAKKATVALPAGAFGAVRVNQNGTLVLNGVYHMTSLDLAQSATIRFSGPTVIYVKTTVDAKAKSRIVLDQQIAGLKASDMVIFVEGDDEHGCDAETDEDGDNPGRVTVQIGTNSVVQANIYAAHGTVWLKSKTQGTGAFIGMHVRIGTKVTLTLDSAFR